MVNTLLLVWWIKRRNCWRHCHYHFDHFIRRWLDHIRRDNCSQHFYMAQDFTRVVQFMVQRVSSLLGYVFKLQRTTIYLQFQFLESRAGTSHWLHGLTVSQQSISYYDLSTVDLLQQNSEHEQSECNMKRDKFLWEGSARTVAWGAYLEVWYCVEDGVHYMAMRMKSYYPDGTSDKKLIIHLKSSGSNVIINLEDETKRTLDEG